MKDSKFIELINLYIDQQIGPAEAALLEEEILRNPHRRKIYNQYCRMHRASALLFEQSLPQANPSGKLAAAAVDVEKKIVAFPEEVSHGSHRKWVYGAGLVAAAACVALVLTRPSFAPSTIAQTGPAEATQVGSSEMAVLVPTVEKAPATGRYVMTKTTAGEDSLATVSLQSDDATLGWMKEVRLAPVARFSPEQLKFETQTPQQVDQRVFGNGDAPEVERVSFEFQR